MADENLKKPRPSEAAKTFLSHKLDKLPYPILIGQDNLEILDTKEPHAALSANNTYKDFLPYLERYERDMIADYLIEEALERGDAKRAQLIKTIITIPEPKENHIHELNLSRAEEAGLRREIAALDEEVSKKAVIPSYFRLIEKIASGEDLPRNYQTGLLIGTMELDGIVDDHKLIIDRVKDMPLPTDLLSFAQKKLDKQGLDFEVPQHDPHLEEHLARQLRLPGETRQKLLPQVEQIYSEAIKLNKALVSDIRRE